MGRGAIQMESFRLIDYWEFGEAMLNTFNYFRFKFV